MGKGHGQTFVKWNSNGQQTWKNAQVHCHQTQCKIIVIFHPISCSNYHLKIIWKSKMINIGKNLGKKVIKFMVEIYTSATIMEDSVKIPQKSEIHLLYSQPFHSQNCIQMKWNKQMRVTYILMFTVTQFITTKMYGQPKCLKMDDCLKKMRHTHIMK